MESPTAISVLSTINSAIFIEKAVTLADFLGLPFIRSLDQRPSELVLAFTPKGLQLLQIPFDSTKTVCLLFVDFVHGKNGFRLARNCTIKQAIARAVGIKSGFRPRVFDGTAGLGSDGFVLASLGCHMTMCERSPLIAALLKDGLSRAAKDSKTSEIVEKHIHLRQEDTKEHLQKTKETYHTIYLDPMYPHRNHSALNKQTMRTIRLLVGDDQDSASLLPIALEKTANRVVVKRPRLAPLLSELQPSHVITMKNSRFDIYLTFRE